MEMTFQPAQRVGEIVAAFPGAANVFKAYGIDFCCGGNRSLTEALRARRVPEQAFLADLKLAYAEAQQRQAVGDWRQAPLPELVEHIVATHHAYLKEELPLLSAFVAKIHHVHGERHPELVTLDQQFQALRAEMEPHMAAEESEFFPRVIAYARSGAAADLRQALATLDELEGEHAAAGQLLGTMRETTRNYRLPADACNTYTLAFQKLEGLESDMFEHVHLENNILFPRLRSAAATAS